MIGPNMIIPNMQSLREASSLASCVADFWRPHVLEGVVPPWTAAQRVAEGVKKYVIEVGILLPALLMSER